MSLPEFVDEPVVVQSDIRSQDQGRPAAFTWRGRPYEIVDWGREWDEEIAGVTWRCYLVRTAVPDTFELRRNGTTGQWVLARAWRRTVKG